MRKYGFMVCALLAMCFNACQMQLEEGFPVDSGFKVLTATTGSGMDTKSSLSPMEEGVSGILWSDNDIIGVFIDGNAKPAPFCIDEGAGTRTATFRGYGSGDSYVGFYPCNEVEALDGETLRMDFPVEQAYVPGSFGEGAYPMVAVSSSDELPFKAVASVFKFSLTGHHTVTRIVFRPNDPSIKVSGPATVSLANPNAPVMEVSSEGADSLFIDTGRLVLDDEEATDFHFVLPARNYKGGFTVRVYTTTGYMDKSYRSDFRMERSKVHPAGVVKVALTSGQESSSTLAGLGTAEDPFRISSLGDLLLLRDAVNTENGTIKRSDGVSILAGSASYLLTKDLDLSPLCSKTKGISWIPIGGNEATSPGFSGVFDGGGHVISNLFSEGGNYASLFGRLNKATVRNLTVSGDISGIFYVGLLAGFSTDSTLEYCVSKGSVRGSEWYIGGLVGMSYSTNLSYCSNEAEVIGRSESGGIVGRGNSANYMLYCTNYGKITVSETSAGGLAGTLDMERLINCTNYGSVEGRDRVGGIAGFISQGAKIFNSVNYGEVKGEDFVGGLAGMVSCVATAYMGPATVANSINFAKVRMIGGRFGGMIAGFLGVPDNEKPLPGEPLDAAWAKNNYWLASEGSLSAAGGGSGIAENNFALSDAQMKGAPYEGILYTVPKKGTTYDTLIDALNAGAVEWSKNMNNQVGGDRRDHFPLSGWVYAKAGTYPSHSDLEAQLPGENKPVFEISDSEFTFNVKGGGFMVEVTSNYDYSAGTLPSWIKAGGTREKAGRPHTHQHSFTVTENRTGSERSAVLTFTNSEGQSRKVKVIQKAPYLEIRETEFKFPAFGGSKALQVSSSVDWKVVGEHDWLKVTPKAGTGDGVVSLLVDRNKLSNAREGSVDIMTVDGSVKYTVTMLQSGSSGGEIGNWEELPFYHQSVVFRFTATWCVWCPYMNKAILRAQELYPDKLQQLALHSGGSDLQFDPAGTLMGTFHSNAFPTGIVDGRIRVNNGENVDDFAPEYISASKETEEKYGTSSGLSLRSVMSGQKVTIDIDAYFKTHGDYKITVLLVEDGIIHYQENGGLDYQHDNIVCATATDILGDPFRISHGPSKRTFSYVLPVPNGAKVEKLRVFAYIQKAFGSLQKIQTEDYGDYYVDNCATAPVGSQLLLRLVGDESGGSGGSGNGNEEIGTGDEIR